jgi:hypothetical protein
MLKNVKWDIEMRCLRRKGTAGRFICVSNFVAWTLRHIAGSNFNDPSHFRYCSGDHAYFQFATCSLLAEQKLSCPVFVSILACLGSSTMSGNKLLQN